MKKSFLIAVALIMTVTATQAQWAVIDPTNLAGNIVNTTKSIAESARTTTGVVNTFNETKKVYEQGKKYYDALKAVNHLVRDAKKVQQTVLMVGDITDMYIDGFGRMTVDPNFTLEELTSIGRGYGILLGESNDVLTELRNVVNASGLSMTDKDRMDVVDKTYWQVYNYRNLVRYYTDKNIGVSYLRAQKKNDQQRVLDLYGSTSDRYW